MPATEKLQREVKGQALGRCRATLLWESPSVQDRPQADGQSHLFVVITRVRGGFNRPRHRPALLEAPAALCSDQLPSAPPWFQHVPHFIAKLFPAQAGHSLCNGGALSPNSCFGRSPASTTPASIFRCCCVLPSAVPRGWLSPWEQVTGLTVSPPQRYQAVSLHSDKICAILHWLTLSPCSS